MDTNTCDKCGIEIESEELVWISADDFEATEEDCAMGYSEEKHLKMINKGYDALCPMCYEEEIMG